MNNNDYLNRQLKNYIDRLIDEEDERKVDMQRIDKNVCREKFYINSRDFCCLTERLFDELTKLGYKYVYKCENRKKPGYWCWFFPMSQKLAGTLELLLNKEIVWDEEKWY